MSEAPKTTMAAVAATITLLDEAVAGKDEDAEAAEEIIMIIMIINKNHMLQLRQEGSLFLGLQGAQEKWK
jgi:hypothetical protein